MGIGIQRRDFELIGDPLDFRFELQFLGDLRIAFVKEQQFHDYLYLGRGKFKTQEVEDDQGRPNKFYVAVDKNPAQMRKEVLSTRLHTILGPLYPNRQFFFKKFNGYIYCDRRVLVSVQVTGEESARLNWCQAKRVEYGIDQAVVEEAFGHFIVAGGPGS